MAVKPGRTRRFRRGAVTAGAGPERGPAKVAAVVQVNIARIGERGEGLAAGPGGPLYVPLTVPGDRLIVAPGEPRGEGRAGETVRIITPGPDRVAPACRHFGACGGCAVQHWAPAAVAAWKRARVQAALGRAGLDAVAIDPVVTTPPRVRRRARFAAVRTASALVLGFKVRRGHDVVDVSECPLLQPEIVAVLPRLRARLAPLLAHGQRLEVIVTRLDGGLDVLLSGLAPPDPDARAALADLAAAAGLCRLSWRPSPGAEPEPLVERERAGLRFAGVFVPVPPGGFLQASEDGEAALVAAVAGAVGSVRRVVDLFAGAGTFSLPLVTAGARVHAVDGDAALMGALATAGREAVLTGLGTEVRDLHSRPLSAADLKRTEGVVLDPPRAGARAQAEALAASAVPRVAAVSCNPATFARDARILVDGGYRLERVVPIDQFLWSPHVELVGTFTRR